jgi:hypothetical protein
MSEKENKASDPRSSFDEVHVPGSVLLKKGDKFTISGLRRMKDGSFTTSCKPGKETIFVANVNYAEQQKMDGKRERY